MNITLFIYKFKKINIMIESIFKTQRVLAVIVDVLLRDYYETFIYKQWQNKISKRKYRDVHSRIFFLVRLQMEQYCHLPKILINRTFSI